MKNQIINKNVFNNIPKIGNPCIGNKLIYDLIERKFVDDYNPNVVFIYAHNIQKQYKSIKMNINSLYSLYGLC
jgi:hypothetical protein